VNACGQGEGKFFYIPLSLFSLGPYIYDVHTEGGQAQVDTCGRGGGQNYNDILVAFQLLVRKVIVLAVSRERCVFNVDGVWGDRSGSGGQGRGIKNPIFLWTS